MNSLHRFFYFSSVCVASNQIIQIIGDNKEIVSLRCPISTNNLGAESWLSNLEIEVRSTLKSSFNYTMAYIQDKNLSSTLLWPEIYSKLPLTLPKQICLLIAQAIRTKYLEIIIVKNPRAIRSFSEQTNQNISMLSDLLNAEKSINHSSGLKYFLLYELEARDFERKLINESVSSLKEFDWICFAKYEYDELNENLNVRQFMHKCQYEFEDLGEHIYVSRELLPYKLAQNIWMALDGKYGIYSQCKDPFYSWQNFEAFALMTGGYLVSIPCTITMNTKAISRILIGIALSGCYSRFQNLDCLKIDCLDFFFKSMKTLKDILRNKKGSNCSFLGKSLKLHNQIKFPCFVTVSKQFDSSKQILFNSDMRSISISKPNLFIMARIYLLVENFLNFIDLGNQLAEAFTELKNILPSASCYDFSYQSMKSLIKFASVLRKNSKESERIVIIRSLGHMYLPRLLDSDKDSYYRIMRSVFRDHEFTDLREINSGAKDDSDMFNILSFAQNMILFGETGCGKSSLIKRFSSKMKAKTVFINPSGLNPVMILGYFNHGTYVPGILEIIMHDTSESLLAVFDGSFNGWTFDIINAFIGDGLVLNNGKKVSSRSGLRLVLEMESLRAVSPACIPLFNLIHVKRDWSWKDEFCIFFKGLEERDQSYKGDIHVFEYLLEIYLKNLFEILQQAKTFSSEKTLVRSFFSHFSTFCNIMLPSPLDDASRIENIIQYCIIWSCYTAIFNTDKIVFRHKFIEMIRTINSNCSLSALITFNQSLDLLDVDYNVDKNIWVAKTIFNLIEEKVIFHSKAFLKTNQNILITGPIGYGKSYFSMNSVKGLDESFITFSTSAVRDVSGHHIHDFLNKALIPSVKMDIFVPANDKKLIIFVDDIQISQHGSNNTLCEFLYSLIDRQGYWSSSSCFLFCRSLHNRLTLGMKWQRESHLRMKGK